MLMGFTEAKGFRIFAFDGVATDHSRTLFTVKADLCLARKYGVRLQELPLLCRAVLERAEEAERRSFTYSEQEMRVHAEVAAARELASKNRKPPRRPTPTHASQAVDTHH